MSIYLEQDRGKVPKSEQIFAIIIHFSDSKNIRKIFI